MSEPDDPDEATLDDAADDLTDEELAAALEWLHGPRNPLAGYATPATRPRKPAATGRGMHNVLRTL
ncbi:hypothetical protein [Streptomyces sp. NBC_00582]|uniref:hypothetical protein n=1 Tax=Streptomyces sp. NBC_00582 TaxID=2975783 RepID=UPI002E81F474|nr:hypothetical protein [Streptomyces sp. NBC_00582]WUB64637.1 hypothetical protein OG852_31665 [Streptomyces sp. NBC_00582]